MLLVIYYQREIAVETYDMHTLSRGTLINVRLILWKKAFVLYTYVCVCVCVCVQRTKKNSTCAKDKRLTNRRANNPLWRAAITETMITEICVCDVCVCVCVCVCVRVVCVCVLCVCVCVCVCVLCVCGLCVCVCVVCVCCVCVLCVFVVWKEFSSQPFGRNDYVTFKLVYTSYSDHCQYFMSSRHNKL